MQKIDYMYDSIYDEIAFVIFSRNHFLVHSVRKSLKNSTPKMRAKRVYVIVM